MDPCYYSLIRRTRDGLFVGWIPNLPGVTASADNESEIVHRLSRDARDLIRRITAKGLPLPSPSATDRLPLGDREGPCGRLLLVLS